MDFLLIQGLIFGPPVAATVFFVKSLRKFLQTPKGSHGRKNRRFALVLSSITLVVAWTALVAFALLFMYELANM